MTAYIRSGAVIPRAQSIAEHDLRGAREHEPRTHDRLGLVEHVRLVIPQVHLARGVEQVGRDALRLERFRRARDSAGKSSNAFISSCSSGSDEHRSRRRRP